MSTSVDYKKLDKALYQPPAKPVKIQVPPTLYLMVDGTGEPGGASYTEALEILYSLSYTIKMSPKSGAAPAGYFAYTVPPLEGLWELGPEGLLSDRESWRWTSLIRQPEFVTPEVFENAKKAAAEKKPELNFARARLEAFEEGLCVQMMHIGPYSTEPETIRQLQDFMGQNALAEDFTPNRRHHEIYLSDPRKTAPEKMKTVLRLPVKETAGGQ